MLAAGALASAATASPRVLDITVTSEAGQNLASVPAVEFRLGSSAGVSITIDPADVQQTIDGIGSSFTESSAFVLAHLKPERRRAVMERIFGEDGANFTLTRTHIGSCDFSVEGRYSYQDSADATFTITPDLAGFDPAIYPGIKDETYDLLPMIREAAEIKRAQGDEPPRLVASAWTAPPWMKDTSEWFTPG
ncbi:MAG: glycosyl hydrolase, partial [Planctomycetota bacterium]